MKNEQAQAIIENAKKFKEFPQVLYELKYFIVIDDIPPFPGSFHTSTYTGTVTELFTGTQDRMKRIADYLAGQGIESVITIYNPQYR